ncbi:MAG: hypothetical protein ACXWT0_03935 [Methylobacter sp.]
MRNKNGLYICKLCALPITPLQSRVMIWQNDGAHTVHRVCRDNQPDEK